MASLYARTTTLIPAEQVVMIAVPYVENVSAGALTTLHPAAPAVGMTTAERAGWQTSSNPYQSGCFVVTRDGTAFDSTAITTTAQVDILSSYIERGIITIQDVAGGAFLNRADLLALKLEN